MRNYIIVTGVLGYIGLHIASAIIAQGYNLIGIDVKDNSADILNNLRKIYDSPSDTVFIKCNLESRSNTLGCLKIIRDMKCRITGICHCAGAFDKTGQQNHDELKNRFGQNIITLENTLLIASKTRPDKFVFPDALCSLDMENWSYLGVSKKLCKSRICEESLFNCDTKFVSIYIGMMYGTLPFVPVVRGRTLENEIDRVKNLTAVNVPVICGYANKAMREWVYPVSPYDVIGAFMYALTFDSRNDIDLTVGVVNEDNRLEPFNLFRFIDSMLEGYPARECLYMTCNGQMLGKTSYLAKKVSGKPSFQHGVCEDQSEMYLSCVPPKMLDVPPKAVVPADMRCLNFYADLETLLQERNSKNGMINLLKAIVNL